MARPTNADMGMNMKKKTTARGSNVRIASFDKLRPPSELKMMARVNRNIQDLLGRQREQLACALVVAAALALIIALVSGAGDGSVGRLA
jgi:hypothetical protein